MKRRIAALLIFLGENLRGASAVERDQGGFRVAGPVLAPDWLPEHQHELATYLATESGKTLIARGVAVQANAAIAACNNPSPENPPARAAGFGDCLTWIGTLTKISRASSVTEAPGPEEGQTDTPPIGELALREAMSP